MGKHEYSDNEKEELKILSENIVYYRTKSKKSQKQVAEEMGIEKSNYQTIERGSKNISYLVQVKLSKSLNITTDKLVKKRKKNKS